VKAAVGDYVSEVNGADLKVPTNFYGAFEGTEASRRSCGSTTVPRGRVLDGDGVPVRDDGGLRSAPGWRATGARWTRSRTDGIAYVWLPNTAEDGYTYFNRYYFAQQNKEGRHRRGFNSGGSIAELHGQVCPHAAGYLNKPGSVIASRSTLPGRNLGPRSC